MKPVVGLALRMYRALARAFPFEFAAAYGDDLVQSAEDSVHDVWRRHGVLGLLRLLADLAWRVPAEHIAELRRDARYGLRMLARSPGFTAVALTSLALGICIATCAYSEMRGLLRDLHGVPRPEELVALQTPVSYPAYQRLRQLDNLFSATFAYVAPVAFGVSSGERTERTWGQLVTPDYFSTLGVRPSLGRFLDGSEEPGAPVVVVSRRFWEQHLGSDRSVVGRALRINSRRCTVIGVGPEGFLGASPAVFAADLWLPVSVDPRVAPELADHALERYDLTMFHMTGRLRPGVSEAAAEEQLTGAARQLADSFGEGEEYRHGRRVLLLGAGKVMPWRKQDMPFFKEFFLIMGGLILLIACANVANMMLARAAERRREVALRLALGAGRARLVRQLLTESLLLAAGAAVPAFPLCVWLMHLLSRLRMPFPVEVTFDLTPDWHALVFTCGVTGVAALAFGLAPAFEATRTDLVTPLKEGGKTRVRRYRALSLRNGLVLAQMTASLMLLLITGYMGMGIQSKLGVQEGFDARNLYLVSLDPVRDGYAPARAAESLDKLLDRVRAAPGISAACLTDTLPVAFDGNSGVRVTGMRETDWARRHMVGRGYFETAGIRILSGRAFRKEDETAGAPVVVSQEAVRRFWNGRDPVGRRIEIGNGAASGNFGAWVGTIDYRAAVLARETRPYLVIGVASDVSEDLVASKKHPAIYFPLRPSDYAQPSLRGVTLMVRSAPGVDAIGAVRREIAALDPGLTAFQARGMSEHIAEYMSALTGASWTYGCMGFFGLVLASVGLAGVTAYSVAQRGHEIGIRMALGARKGDVLALVMKEGVLLVLAGTVLGMALAWAGTRALSGVFYTVGSVQTSDPLLLLGAPALLASLALAACYLPARRSTHIDPVVTLRME